MAISKRIRKRLAIQTLLQAGWSVSQIARKVKCDRGTVLKWKKQMAKDSRVEDLPRSGRPRALNKPNRRKLASRVEGKRYRSVRKTSKYFATQGVSASKSAIHRELRRQNLQPYHRPKVPKLTRAQRQKRVAFARAMENHDWDKTLMSAETEMRLHSAQDGQTPRTTWYGLTVGRKCPQDRWWHILPPSGSGLVLRRPDGPTFTSTRATSLPRST